VVTVLALWVVAVTGAPAAQAHAILLSTSPADSAALAQAPKEVSLTFNEPPMGIGTTVRVTGPAGMVSQGRPRVIDNTVHQTLNTGLGGGKYTVAWRATSIDGHPVSGTFAFTVRGGSIPPAATTTPEGTAMLRARGARNTGTTFPMLWAAIAATVLLSAALAASPAMRHRIHARKT
jgi:methionine-rich copper-binding protein CopC